MGAYSLAGNIALAGALGNAAARYPQAKREEEEYQTKKAREKQVWDWQVQDRKDQEATADAAFSEAERFGLTAGGEFTGPEEMAQETGLINHAGEIDAAYGFTPETAGMSGGGVVLANPKGGKGSVGMGGTVQGSAKSGGKDPVGAVLAGKPGTPGNQLPGGGSMGMYLRDQIANMNKRYKPLHGRARSIMDEYQKEIQAAGTDQAKIRAAKIKMSKRIEGIRPQFEKLDGEYAELQKNVAMARANEKVDRLVQVLWSIPQDAKERDAWVEQKLVPQKQLLEELGIDMEDLRKAKVYTDTLKIGDFEKKGQTVIELPSGDKIPLTLEMLYRTKQITPAMYVEGRLKYQKEMDDTKLQISMHKNQTDLYREQIQAQARVRSAELAAMRASQREDRMRLMEQNIARFHMNYRDLLKDDGKGGKYLDMEGDAFKKLSPDKQEQIKNEYIVVISDWPIVSGSKHRTDPIKLQHGAQRIDLAKEGLDLKRESAEFKNAKDLVLLDTRKRKVPASQIIDLINKAQTNDDLKSIDSITSLYAGDRSVTDAFSARAALIRSMGTNAGGRVPGAATQATGTNEDKSF